MHKSKFMEKLLNGVEVEWKKLGEIGQVIRGNGMQKKDFVENGFPAIHYGQIYTKYGLTADKTFTFVSNELAKKLKIANKNDLLIATTSENDEDVLKPVAWLGKQVAISGDMMLFRHNENVKYLAYYFQTTMLQKQKMKYITGTKVRRISRDNLEKLEIPIPPLEAQRKIVEILDNFTELTAELTAELSARKKQYNYYRDKLLTFKDDEVEWKKLGEVINIKRGKRVVKSQLEEFGYYPVYQNSMKPLGYYYENNAEANTTFIISAGAAGEIGYSNVKFWAADDVYLLLTQHNINSKFLYYFLLTKQYQLLSQVRRASIPRLSKIAIEKLIIPIPPLEKQKKIVEILDKFDTLTNSINEGLPKEIELRQKQYEYYRDMLLSFSKENTNE